MVPPSVVGTTARGPPTCLLSAVMGIAMIGNDIGNLLARVEACCKDGDVYVVLVVGRIAPAVSHVAPALAVALNVPDVLVPDHVVDPERLRVGLGPRRNLVAKCFPDADR